MRGLMSTQDIARYPMLDSIFLQKGGQMRYHNLVGTSVGAKGTVVGVAISALAGRLNQGCQYM